MDPRTNVTLCRGNFFISKSREGSSCNLNRLWARLSIFRAKRAYHPFSVSAHEATASVNKALCGTPSRIADPGVFWAIFQIGCFPKSCCVVSINAFEISMLVTGLVTVDAAWRRITVSGGRESREESHREKSSYVNP